MKKCMVVIGILALLLSGCQKESVIKIKNPGSYQLLIIGKTKNNRNVPGESIIIKDQKLIQNIFKEAEGLKGESLPAKKLIGIMKSQETINLSFTKKSSLHHLLHIDYTLDLLKDGRIIFPDTTQTPIKIAFITTKSHPNVIEHIKNLIEKGKEK